MKRTSLRFKLWMTLMALTVVISVVLGAIAIYRLYYELDEQFIKRAEGLAHHIAQEFIDAPSQDRYDAISSMLAGLLTSDLAYVQIVHRSQILRESYLNDSFNPKEVLAPVALIRRIPSSDGSPVLDLVYPFTLKNEGEPQGYVRLGLLQTYLSEEIQLEAKVIGAASLGVMLLGTVLATWFHRKLMRPISLLSDSVKAFGSGALQVRAEVQTKDELQDLAEDFNKMADSIVGMQEELKQANKAKSEFLTVMGHELRTPLNALMGYSELLLEEVDGSLSSAQKKHLRAAQRSGQHMSELIENMLRFSKLEMGAEQLRLQQVDCKQIIEEALQALSVTAQERKIELRFSRRTALRWVADSMKLRQILLNLVDNAIKYSEHGPVEINVKHMGNEAIFFVKDRGSGIAEKDLEKIFKPFTQLGNAARRESRGIGLGLAIVKRYVEMHHGRLWVESVIGQGSTFAFALPQLAFGEKNTAA